MSRMRAVEHDRAVVVAATSGESAIIAPDGAVIARSALFTPAALVSQVPLLTSTTLATRLGAWPEWVLTVLGLAAVAAWPFRGRAARAAGERDGRRQG
jgi:apolipoprotein N-acyltransferase